MSRIDSMLDRSRSHRGGALLIRGEPGIGKTALLLAARERMEGMLAVVTSGAQSEARLPFAALGELVAPMIGRIDDLPAPQAAALSSALALAPTSGVVNERLATFAGFLGLIRLNCREQPLLICVDDAQWLDEPSSDCLSYAARRLGPLGAVMLIAARAESEVEALSDSVDEEVWLEGLWRGDALAMLAPAELATPVAETVLNLSLGNPLALTELPAMLTDEQRRGAAPIDPSFAPTGALGEALQRRVTAAGPEAGRLLLIAAISLDRTIEPVIAAARELKIPDEALEVCEEAGLLELRADSFRLAHPLLQAVACDAAAPADLRRAHLALAEHSSPDARAWHLSAGTVGPDDVVATALDRAAARAAGRGAHGAAADGLERAASASVDPAEGFGRLYASGLSAAMGGDYERAAALLERAAEVEDPIMRATALHLLAMVTLNGGIRPGLDNHRMLTDEGDRIAPVDGAMAALMHADAGVTATVVGLCDLVLASADRAIACLPPDASPTIRCQAHSVRGMGLALKGRAGEAAEALATAGELLDQVEPVSAAAQSISFALMGRLATGEEETLLRETRDLAEAALKSRSLGILPWFQLQAADAAYRLGEWDSAERDAEDAVTNAEISSQRGPLSIALVIRARIHAARNREEAARADAARGVEIAEPVGYGSVRLWSNACLGFLELGLNRPDEAIAQLEQARMLAALAGLEDPVFVPWAPDLIEAYERVGRQADAAELAAEFGVQAERNGTALALALAARCRGLLADDSFGDEFTQALEFHEHANLPFERARTLLAFGSRLHRSRRRVDARKRLREAEVIFEHLDCPPWRERTRAELRAAGAVSRESADPDLLTAQELRVAEAVARGGTNRQVAAELYLSPKTIDFHLTRVYRKLGIHSRAELATLVASGAKLTRPSA